MILSNNKLPLLARIKSYIIKADSFLIRNHYLHNIYTFAKIVNDRSIYEVKHAKEVAHIE